MQGRIGRLTLAMLLAGAVGAAATLVASAAVTGAKAGSPKRASVPKSCVGLEYGHMGPLTGANAVLGQEELRWDQLALAEFNAAHPGAKWRLVEGDDQLNPSLGPTVAQSLIANPKVLAIVGPGGSPIVVVAGALYGRAHMAMVTPSATLGSLSNGQFPTFFRVNANNDSQAPAVYLLIKNKLKPKKALIIDDQSPDKSQLADEVGQRLQKSGIAVDRQTVSASATDFSALIGRIDSDTGVVFLSFQTASEGQLFGQQMQAVGKHATIVGANGVYSPSQFTIEGAYVTSFGPDIHYVKSAAPFLRKYGSRLGAYGSYGPESYVATQVVLDAMWNACTHGKPTRASVVNWVRKTNLKKTIIGVPVQFAKNGNNRYATFFVFKVVNGKYVPVSVK